ncbi:GIY-YIG nuclease family protein [Candidatus Uhrbacteria bacterium]|nr:GIY-YIG nuclease family protein [Candidatus Uhrbacteria bacterium]
MPRWHVYILRCRDKSLYTGISTDVEARLQKHNAGKGAAYTRSRKPVVLAWSKACKNESFARKQEAKIKSWTKPEKEMFLQDQRAAKTGSPRR